MLKAPVPRISGLHDIAHNYDAILCDVWGVLHNGVVPFQDAVDALAQFRRTGGVVIMITNSPKPAAPVVQQMREIGVPETGVYDDVVTSGDATRALIEEVGGPVYHLGPNRDLVLYEGLQVERVDWREAKAVVCTGLWDDEHETPEDYGGLLAQLYSRRLPLLCANPDIVVERGDGLIWCAGALARDYQALGGETRIAGKPHAPIYNRAVAKLRSLAATPVQKARILAIGDGMPTDITGARDFGLDALYISGGIHAAEYEPASAPEDRRLQAFLRLHGVAPVAYLPRLFW